MRFRIFPLLTALLALQHLPVPTGFSVYAGGQAFEESFDDQRGFRLFGGPSRQGPEHQWERIQEAMEAGRLRRAIRRANQLVRAWPDHELAPAAQRLVGDLYRERGNIEAAFNAYQALIDAYAGLFDYQEILDIQLELAEELQHRVIRALFTSYTQPQEAIPLYQQIIINAPHAEITPELMFRIGDIHLQRRKFREAIDAFNQVEDRFPDSEFAMKAALNRARAFERLARRFPTDASTTISALHAFAHFLDNYPDAEAVDEARERMEYFYDLAARNQYELAVFYETRMSKPEAARVTLQTLLQEFSESEWAVKAATRLETLQPTPTLQ
jgi:outer membrane protein assembly factor BamD (BamD/ComL family)